MKENMPVSSNSVIFKFKVPESPRKISKDTHEHKSEKKCVDELPAGDCLARKEHSYCDQDPQTKLACRRTCGVCSHGGDDDGTLTVKEYLERSFSPSDADVAVGLKTLHDLVPGAKSATLNDIMKMEWHEVLAEKGYVPK